MTKDERYLLKLHQLGGLSGEIDCYEVGRAIGQNDKSVKNIVRMLAQANFIKMGEGNNISLTPQGLKLVSILQGA